MELGTEYKEIYIVDFIKFLIGYLRNDRKHWKRLYIYMNLFFIGKNGQKNANKRTLLELIKNQIEGKISKRIIYSIS